ncbi:MAG: hypothetical protein KatS3mg010_1359 [Acidimicrobiia bacterium]|nr:MAG: hypothetical protein KatS3mg010_1359 [Acidimicrobiia bacterium]
MAWGAGADPASPPPPSAAACSCARVAADPASAVLLAAAATTTDRHESDDEHDAGRGGPRQRERTAPAPSAGRELVPAGGCDRAGDQRVARARRERVRRERVARRGERGPAFVDAGRRVQRGAHTLERQTEIGGGSRELAVELGAEELVDAVGRQGSRVGGHGVRGVGRSATSSRFPSASASAARPLAIRERTVPGGIPSTSAISA